MEIASRNESFLVDVSRLENWSDEKIVRHFLANQNQEAFAVLYRRCEPRVRICCGNILRNSADAEDAVAVVFKKAYEKLGTFRESNFRAWLLSIARNHCLNVIRSRRSTVSEFAEELPQPAAHESSQMEELLHVALPRLAQHQRICLNLFYMEGYSYEEISEMGYTMNEVKSHVQNGKRNLKKLMDELSRKPG